MPRTFDHGGVRQGAQGKTYSNRTDLNGSSTQPIRTAPSQQYGQGVQQIQAQQAIPLPNSQVMPPQPLASSLSSGPLPGELPSLNAPTARPGEPVTHGSSSGPGGGPEALTPMGGLGQDVGSVIRSLYSRYPNSDLRDLLEVFDRQNGNI